MTTTELWQSLRDALRAKGATDAWIEYAMPDLQIASTQYAAQCYGNGHDDARRGWPLPNPEPTDPPLNIVTEADGSRWLELLPEKTLNEHIAELERDNSSALSHVRGDMKIKAPLPSDMLDTPEARARLQAMVTPETWPDGVTKRRNADGDVLHGCEMCDGEDECTCPGNVNGRKGF